MYWDNRTGQPAKNRFPNKFDTDECIMYWDNPIMYWDNSYIHFCVFVRDANTGRDNHSDWTYHTSKLNWKLFLGTALIYILMYCIWSSLSSMISDRADSFADRTIPPGPHKS